MKRYKYKAVAFSGPSNSGKTTLIEKLAKTLTKEYKVLVIKHDPKDKAKFDVEGKDSYKFFNTGADTIVLSPTRTTYFSHEYNTVENMIKLYDFDYLLVEGLKEIKLPRISVFRREIDESYLPFSDAVAIDDTVKNRDLTNLDILDLNDTKQVLEWIEKNAKVVK